MLRHLPAVELSRLSCVHKAYLNAWKRLQQLHPGRRYAPPCSEVIKEVQGVDRLIRASAFGDVTVIRLIVRIGPKSRRGRPLYLARNPPKKRVVDVALSSAARDGHVQAANCFLLLVQTCTPIVMMRCNQRVTHLSPPRWVIGTPPVGTLAARRARWWAAACRPR